MTPKRVRGKRRVFYTTARRMKRHADFLVFRSKLWDCKIESAHFARDPVLEIMLLGAKPKQRRKLVKEYFQKNIVAKSENDFDRRMYEMLKVKRKP